jgi:hypothetical protein
MKKIYILVLVCICSVAVSAQTLLYSNTFEGGIGDATIVGNGQVVVDHTPGFGSVFHNAAGGQAIRANYLLLPETVFESLQESGRKELTIGFWVNKGTAINNFWTPIFSAYGAAPVGGANTWPMMVLQSRLVGQVNVAGWTDLLDAQNIAGTNLASTAWLDDESWHYYTAVFTETKVKVYVDGIVQNEWNIDGVTAGQVVGGLFTNGSELRYIALGGNQAWNWADPDPAYKFDDVVVYADALTVEQINGIRAAKSLSTDILADNIQLEVVADEYFTLNGMRAGSTFFQLDRGMYIRKAYLSDGSVRVEKINKLK